MHNDHNGWLTVPGRSTRVIPSLAPVMVTIAGQGNLGIYAMLPLAVIYPGITGLPGYDPLTSLSSRQSPRRNGGIPIAPPAVLAG